MMLECLQVLIPGFSSCLLSSFFPLCYIWFTVYNAFRVLTEECKKLKIDISSLQLSNRSLVNQNRDEKKKVMDCRLQIADLEGRLKSFDATKQDLTDCQAQIERLRMTLESNEAKLADAERRADESSGLIKVLLVQIKLYFSD